MSSQKLPIYSSGGESVQVVETHTVLEEHVGDIRRAVVGATEDARQKVQGVVSEWIGVERKVERRVLDILPPDERLNPGALYVGVATLAGSVFGRYRSLPIRLVAPPLFFLGSLNYFLPKTSHNLSLYYQELEARHLPSSVKSQREQLSSSLRSMWGQTRDSLQTATQKVEGGWKGGLTKVQQETGLQVAPSESKKQV
ncbi:unnamed protein product [Parajaminaea phylloscopi]